MDVTTVIVLTRLIDMPVERAHGSTSLIDVMDRVLDKGIVIEAWTREALAGIDIVTVEARVVVDSLHPSFSRKGRHDEAGATLPTFGSLTSSRSAVPTDDDDDDDEGGPGGSGSGGAAALLDYPREPRVRRPSPRDRTRRH